MSLAGFFDDAVDQIVPDQLAGVHDLGYFLAQSGPALDLGAQGVAGGEMEDAEMLGDPAGLGPFAAGLGPDDGDVHCLPLGTIRTVKTGHSAEVTGAE